MIDIVKQTSEIDSLTASYSKRIVDLRRHFHRNPELSWQEEKTSAHLRHLLAEDGVEVSTDLCPPGLVATLHGAGTGPTIAIRADMDALPLQETNDVPYASQEPEVMHACGHDCHMAMLYGVARVLKASNVEFAGKVKFIFQPCEESLPSGASKLVQAGALDDVDVIYAYHVDPEIAAGKIGLRSGALTAQCNEFTLTLRGSSGHAARPHQAVDTIYLGSKILDALYEAAALRAEPLRPAVLAVGKIVGGRKANVVADELTLAGTVRTLGERDWLDMKERFERIVAMMAESFGASARFEFGEPIPAVYNDPALISVVRTVATDMIGPENIVDIPNVSMGGEDFAWYLTKAPGALIRLGVRRGDHPVTPLHSSDFDVDESALPLGVSLMAKTVIEFFAGAS